MPPQPKSKYKRITPLDVEGMLERCSGYHCDFVRCMATEINQLIEEALGIKKSSPSTIVLVGTTASDDCKE